ncbi:transcriptional regulator [Lactococcus piscium]|uniref:Transcriptional regulator n=1 Tax=Pseudolactococcus piscium TaxID=1364 RepID=A0A2A5S229_9LACT|nr:AsnC family transcriptional regulator [Lactococcus piscium]PCS07514.1 transcriptional regulator [Lactococcus piscium]
MKGIILDNIDHQILAYLKSNAKLTNKDIGQLIHMTGQAVGIRINKLIDAGHIQNYTISIQYDHKQFIRVFMDNNQYDTFEAAVNAYPEVADFYKVSGQACYMIVGHFSHEKLAQFITTISRWGRYSIETVLDNRKKDRQ